jgi:phosphoglycolate phosphatase
MSTNPIQDAPELSGIRTLIFDLDGTLIDSAADLAISVNASLDYLRREPLTHDEIFSYVGRGAAELIRRALGANGTAAEAEEGLRYFLEYYRAHMLDHTAPYPGVHEALRELAAYPMAVLTNKPVRFSRAILEGLHLAHFFQHVYGGNSFERKKPDAQGMGVLLGEMGVGPREAIMIGDSDVDVQTARNAGTWACGVTYGFGATGFTAWPPDLLLDSLAELPALLK